MAAQGWSLRTRLTALLTALALLAWSASSLWLYRSAADEVGELADAALVETAHAVLAVVDHELREHEDDDDEDEREIELPRIGHAHDERLFYQVRSAAGALVYRSPGAPAAALAAADARGFGSAVVEGRSYRVYSLRSDDGTTAIHLAQPLDDRRRLMHESALRLLAPGALLIALLALGSALVVGRVMRPVVAFSQGIDARRPGDARPVDAQDLPRELQPVARAVDGLLARVDDALRQERTLTADAAHELRTPLAALRAQAQVALRASAADERAEALQALMQGVDRATRLVNAVLTLARLDARELDRAALPAVDLAQLAQWAIDAQQPIASRRGIVLRLAPPAAPAILRADADALSILLANLVDNALRHAQSKVHVEVERHAQGWRLAIDDDGPGLSAQEAARVFDRFYRGQAADAEGSGLGLALVRRVAELHGGSTAVVRSALGGARFEVALPD